MKEKERREEEEKGEEKEGKNREKEGERKWRERETREKKNEKEKKGKKFIFFFHIGEKTQPSPEVIFRCTEKTQKEEQKNHSHEKID